MATNDRNRSDQRARLELLEQVGRRRAGTEGGAIALAAVVLCFELRELRAELAVGNVEAAEVRLELRALVEVAHSFAEAGDAREVRDDLELGGFRT